MHSKLFRYDRKLHIPAEAEIKRRELIKNSQTEEIGDRPVITHTPCLCNRIPINLISCHILLDLADLYSSNASEKIRQFLILHRHITRCLLLFVLTITM